VKTLERHIRKEQEMLLKDATKLEKMPFITVEKTQQALHDFRNKIKFHKFEYELEFKTSAVDR
jgi:hypothetical protein